MNTPWWIDEARRDPRFVMEGMGILLLIIACAVLLPLGGIWALNTLFGYDLAYSAANLLAALVLMMILKAIFGSSE